jgi:hypothetical protein
MLCRLLDIYRRFAESAALIFEIPFYFIYVDHHRLFAQKIVSIRVDCFEKPTASHQESKAFYSELPIWTVASYGVCFQFINIVFLYNIVRTVNEHIKYGTVLQMYLTIHKYSIATNVIYEGGPKNNRNLNVARELELVARCAARCRESTP